MKLAALFSDHAVLQREIPIPVWGWTSPNTRVEVKLGSKRAEFFAGDDGKFMVRLPAMPAGGPYELTATDLLSGESVTVQDIWVGEVWVASGQSNMEWTLQHINQCNQPDNQLVRMINVPRAAIVKRTDIPATWQTVNKLSQPAFSAVGYFFALELQKKLNVHVGIIHSSWGGTIAEAWTSRETLRRNPDMQGRLDSYDALLMNPATWAEEDYKEICSAGPRFAAGGYPVDPGNQGIGQGWASNDFDDSNWTEALLPGAWTGFGNRFSGVFWFRKNIEIPSGWAGQALLLEVGAVDKQDITYFNGSQVGATGCNFEDQHWCVPRSYPVPAELVKAGRCTIAVRAYSFVFDGGLIGPADTMRIFPVGKPEEAIPLSGNWRYQIEHNFGVIAPNLPLLGPGNPNSPYILFDNMIAPLLPYAIRGTIWYQGESNSNNAIQYRRMFGDMIEDWRRAWGQGDFPFLFVQLANFNAGAIENWPALREAQLQTLAEPNTGMAVTIDIGEPINIHPANKAEVGRRLSLLALKQAYHQCLVASGPIFRDLVVDGSSLRLRFDHIGSGLTAANNNLDGFIIAGMNREFFPATARIEGDSVIVSNPEKVQNPVAVRYCWSSNPPCSLFNAEGLPASPFRTDNWAL